MSTDYNDLYASALRVVRERDTDIAFLKQEINELKADNTRLREVLAAHGYSGPLTPGYCPLENWLADDTRAMKEPE